MEKPYSDRAAVYSTPRASDVCHDGTACRSRGQPFFGGEKGASPCRCDGEAGRGVPARTHTTSLVSGVVSEASTAVCGRSNAWEGEAVLPLSRDHTTAATRHRRSSQSSPFDASSTSPRSRRVGRKGAAAPLWSGLEHRVRGGTVSVPTSPSTAFLMGCGTHSRSSSHPGESHPRRKCATGTTPAVWRQEEELQRDVEEGAMAHPQRDTPSAEMTRTLPDTLKVKTHGERSEEPKQKEECPASVPQGELGNPSSCHPCEEKAGVVPQSPSSDATPPPPPLVARPASRGMGVHGVDDGTTRVPSLVENSDPVLRSSAPVERRATDAPLALSAVPRSATTAGEGGCSPEDSSLSDMRHEEVEAREDIHREEVLHRERLARKHKFLRVHHDNMHFRDQMLHRYFTLFAHTTARRLPTTTPPPRDLSFVHRLVQVGEMKIQRVLDRRRRRGHMAEGQQRLQANGKGEAPPSVTVFPICPAGQDPPQGRERHPPYHPPGAHGASSPSPQGLLRTRRNCSRRASQKRAVHGMASSAPTGSHAVNGTAPRNAGSSLFSFRGNSFRTPERRSACRLSGAGPMMSSSSAVPHPNRGGEGGRAVSIGAALARSTLHRITARSKTPLTASRSALVRTSAPVADTAQRSGRGLTSPSPPPPSLLCTKESGGRTPSQTASGTARCPSTPTPTPSDATGGRNRRGPHALRTATPSLLSSSLSKRAGLGPLPHGPADEASAAALRSRSSDIVWSEETPPPACEPSAGDAQAK